MSMITIKHAIYALSQHVLHLELKCALYKLWGCLQELVCLRLVCVTNGIFYLIGNMFSTPGGSKFNNILVPATCVRMC